MKSYFTTRELVYLALITVLLYIVSFVAIMSASLVTAFPGAKSIASAFFTAIILALGCMWVRKIGTMSFIMLLWGLISALLFPAVPILLPTTLSGGIAADLLVALLKTDYSNEKATTLACGVRSGISTVVVLSLVLIFGSSSLRGASLFFRVFDALIHVQLLTNILALGGVSGPTLGLMSQLLILGALGALMPNLGVAPWIVEFSMSMLGLVGFQSAGLEVILTPLLILGVSAVCAVLGTIGGYVGVRIGRELKLAGVYK